MVKIGFKILLAKDVWEISPRELTKFTGAPRTDLVGLDESIYTRLDDKITTRATNDGVWAAATRTLTQTQFPFWSVLIHQTQSSVTVAAGTSPFISIQPPTGETWLVWLDFCMITYVAGTYVVYYDYDGTTTRMHNYSYTKGSYGEVVPHLGVSKIWTNSLYARLRFKNPDTVTRYGQYGYSGFKLSKPLWSPRRLQHNPEAKPWKKARTKPLPPVIGALDKYAFDILDLDIERIGEYELGIILEEDTPIAIDPKTGEVVERFTSVVEAKVLAEYIEKFKAGTADPVLTGYKKYLDKWKGEGIELL